MNAHQREISSEENFNNQVYRMILSVNNGQPLSLATLSLPDGLMDRVAMLTGMEVMHGLSNIDFHSSVLSWLWSLPAAEINIETLI